MIFVGCIIVIVSTIVGFLMAGGKLILLIHVSEMVVIGGICVGVLVIASPTTIIKGMIKDIMHVIKGGAPGKKDFEDLFKLLYELFNIGRKGGLIALDEHIGDPKASSILSKYPSLLGHHERVEFLVGALRPLVDGKLKPEQLLPVLESEIEAMQDEAHGPITIISLIGDSLPGIGIVAAVLGIINTMSSISEGPEKVGEKVSAALTGTFLGVFAAYGFINPLAKRIGFMHASSFSYLTTMALCISNYAKGMTPLVAIEVVRRSLDSSLKPDGDALEEALKQLG